MTITSPTPLLYSKVDTWIKVFNLNSYIVNDMSSDGVETTLIANDFVIHAICSGFGKTEHEERV